MLAMDRISEPKVSPDGRWIVFTLRKTDLEADRGRTDLWLIGTDGEGLKQLTTHPENDSNPCFSADGKSIFFISSRSGSSQIWRLPIDGGEARQITDLPLDVGNLVVSPDDEHIAFTVEVFANLSIEQTKKKLDEKESSKSSGVIYDKIFIRHWDTWKDGRRSHLFVMPADGGEPVDLMPDFDADTPSKPFGGPDEITFTPDGKELIFTARNVGLKEAWSTDFDLFIVPIDASQVPQCLTIVNDAWDTAPAFSPDGKNLAYLAMTRPGYESDRLRIVIRRWPDGPEKILTAKWDRSVSQYCWSANSKTIYATAQNLGQKSLFAVDVSDAEVKTLVEQGSISSPAVANDRIIYSMNNLKSPAELYSVKPDGKSVQQITNINAEKIAAARMGDYEQFSFKGSNDEDVYCYVVKPADFDPNQNCPVAFLIHGGPQGSFGNMFHYRWNPQAYAGAGYAVVMVDFHGSTGYGQYFTDSIRGDWGGKPLEDLQKGLDAALLPGWTLTESGHSVPRSAAI